MTKNYPNADTSINYMVTMISVTFYIVEKRDSQTEQRLKIF